jgi:hypothetical protein
MDLGHYIALIVRLEKYSYSDLEHSVKAVQEDNRTKHKYRTSGTRELSIFFVRLGHCDARV